MLTIKNSAVTLSALDVCFSLGHSSHGWKQQGKNHFCARGPEAVAAVHCLQAVGIMAHDADLLCS